MPFKKGQSGNPSGRPTKVLPDGRHLSDVAKEHTEEAVAALVGVLRNKRSSSLAIVQAAAALLDRGWGRPQQMVAVEPPTADIAETIAEMRRRVAQYAELEALGDHRAMLEGRSSKPRLLAPPAGDDD